MTTRAATPRLSKLRCPDCHGFMSHAGCTFCALANGLERLGFPRPEAEVLVVPERLWRWDAAWVDAMVAVEVDGGTWRRDGGAHRGTGAIRDMAKSNAGQIAGWLLLRFTPDQVTSGDALYTVTLALMARGVRGEL